MILDSFNLLPSDCTCNYIRTYITTAIKEQQHRNRMLCRVFGRGHDLC